MGLAMMLASARLRGLAEAELIEEVREWRGAAETTLTRGQVVLARMLLVDDEPLLSTIGGDLLARFLSGEAAPHDAMANRVVGITHGAITAPMFAMRMPREVAA